MPFTKDHETLEKLFARALESQEIQEGINSTGLGRDFFRKELTERADKVWSAATEELSALSRVDEELKAAKLEFREAAPSRPPLLRLLERATQGTFVILISAAVLIGYFVGLDNAIKKLYVMPWSFISFSVLFVVATGIIMRIVLALSYKRQYRRYSKHSKSEDIIRQLEEKQVKALNLIEEVLLERGIKSELRAIINAELQPSYALNISVKTAPGLAEVFDPAYEISTESKAKLVGMLNEMPGGSIGIAGPRGAGKSTLIWSLCRGAISKLRDRPLYALMTSAPVKYDGRDFILHLFSSLCYKVLGRDPAHDMAEDESPFDVYRTPPWWLTSRLARWAALMMAWIGAALLVSGILLTLELIKRPHSERPEVPPTSDNSPDKAVSPQADRTVSSFTWVSFLKATELKPGSFLISGILCVAAGCFLVFLRGSWKQQNAGNIRSELAKQQSKMKAAEQIGEDVAKAADQMLRQIRFQQSYSSGWSGSLKLPIGIEGSMNSALSLAERQRSFPEIVGAYRDFVKAVAAKNAILIGIDELDKLESDEIAQQFLNEIKSIFNLDHCYYLISVSENAISSFERRGLPFRDAFDSAFDTIIYVDYLDLESAKRLLKRRVIGLEVPFICLCHCLSGGLARDLIRSCREMLELVRDEQAPTDLSAVCAKLVTTDIKSKLRAMEVSVRKARLEPELSNMIDTIRKIEESTETSDRFLATRSKLLPPRFRINVEEGVPTDVVETRQRINDLALELHTYLYFAATLLEFFSNTLSEQSLAAAEKAGQITKLARAKQSFSVNTYTALALLDEFRSSNGLAVA